MGNSVDQKRFGQIYTSAARYCSSVERCDAEVRKKLQQWQVDEDLVEQVIEKLKDEKFIDEKRYANAFVKDKFNLNGWGKVKIKHHLMQKNVDMQCITQALNEQIEKGAYTERLKEILTSKERTIKEADPYKKRAKLIHFAQSRGFEISVAVEVVEQLN